jgi:hypothetical protein
MDHNVRRHPFAQPAHGRARRHCAYPPLACVSANRPCPAIGLHRGKAEPAVPNRHRRHPMPARQRGIGVPATEGGVIMGVNVHKPRSDDATRRVQHALSAALDVAQGHDFAVTLVSGDSSPEASRRCFLLSTLVPRFRQGKRQNLTGPGSRSTPACTLTSKAGIRARQRHLGEASLLAGRDHALGLYLVTWLPRVWL